MSKTKIKKKVDKFSSDTDHVGITGATTSLNHLRDWAEASVRESYQPGIKKSSAPGLIDFPQPNPQRSVQGPGSSDLNLYGDRVHGGGSHAHFGKGGLKHIKMSLAIQGRDEMRQELYGQLKRYRSGSSLLSESLAAVGPLAGTAPLHRGN